MAPDWTAPVGEVGFLDTNPEIFKPKAWAELTKTYYPFDRNFSFEDKLAKLVAENFPPRKEGVQVEASGPQGNVIPLTIIDDPADWTSTTWKGREAEYTYYLIEEDVAEIDSAVQSLKDRGLSTEEGLKKLSKEDFLLPKLGPKLIELAKEVSHGRAFQFIKGFPVHKYKEDPFYVIAAYWAFGLHIGRAQIIQTDLNQETGEILASIMNHIVNLGFIGVDGLPQPHSGQPLSFHGDQGSTDVISLLCLSKAKEGGAGKWVSAIAIHNELLRRGRKDLVEVLSQPFKVRKMASQYLPYRNPEGHYEYEDIIPFHYHDGYLSVYFQSLAYFAVELEGGKLTPLQEEAVWAVLALAERPEFHFKHTLQPGDVEWIHNPTIFHAREAYVDGAEDHERRHLVRWWVHTDANKRPIAPSYAPRSSVQAGGGFKVPAGTKVGLPITPPGRK